MKFDVIIGNPPYQMNDGGGTGSSALPIYQMFVEAAKLLTPRYLIMIIPARWFSGGRGLDAFRASMLSDRRIRCLHDFPNSSDCFQGVQIEGGVCYFLWDRDDNKGLCNISTHLGENISRVDTRPLLEEGLDNFLRYSEQVSIFKKIRKVSSQNFSALISSNDPFGYDIREEGCYKRIKPTFSLEKTKDAVKLYYFGWQREGIGYIDKATVRKNRNLIASWKVLISKAYGMGTTPPYQVINKPFVADWDSVCTETYLLIGPFKTKREAENACTYIETMFFRFMVLYKKNTQNAMQGAYSFVPMQDFSKPWTDEELYKKYKLTKDEIAFIESMIKPMD